MPAANLVIFDAIETLFSLAPVRKRLADAGASPDALDVWFGRLLRDAFALTAVGGYASFVDIAEGSLRPVLHDEGLSPAPELLDGVFEAFSTLPAHDDVRPALELVADRGIPVFVLTNGTAETTEQVVKRNGLEPLIDDILTVHEVQRWKPAGEPYRLATSRAGVRADEAALVAVHGWDILGARHAGLRTGWCARLEGHLSPPLGPADVEGDTLVEVVTGLLA